MTNPADAITLPGSWYSTYGYRRALTIQSSQVAANATGFPIAFIRTIADLKTTGNGGKVTSATGADIVFTDSDGTTLLKYEQEKYVATTGEVEYWINADLSATVDKTIYMYYGKAGASNLEDPVNVWPSAYKGVWHMAEDPTISTDGDCGGGTKEMCDSTSGNNDLDTNGNVVSATGYVDGAAAYDGNEDYLRTPNGASSLDSISNLTISLWLYPRPQATTRTLVMKGGEYRLTLEADSNRRIFFTTNRYSGSNQWSISAGQIPVSAWTHIVVTYDGVGNAANDPKIYVNGALKSLQQDLTSTGASGGTTNGVWIGEDWTNVNDIDAIIDEVRISNTIMSANDITTMYNNMFDNTAFMTVASEMPSTGSTALVAHLKMNETAGSTANDSSAGGANDGALSSFPADPWMEAGGRIGGALLFDGADDVVTLPSELIGTGADTVCAWIKPSSSGEGASGRIFENRRLLFYIDGANNRLSLQSDDGVTATANSATNSISYNIWSHVCAARNASGTANIYVNGALSGSANQASGPPTTGTNALVIGNNPATTRTFAGLIDDARVYDRELTADEILDLYTFSGHNLQFCDGTNWISVANSGATSANTPCTAAAETYTTAGLTTTTVPANCTTATIEAWGAGGGGGFSTTTSPATNNRAGGGGGGSGVERSTTMLVAAGGGGGNASTSNASNHRAGGGGGYVIAYGVAVTPAESLNIYVGGGGASSCSANPSGNGGGYNGTNGASGTTPTAVTNPPGVGGAGGNDGANNGGNSTYGGAGGNAGAGSAGTSTYGGNGGSGAGGSGGGGFGGTVTTGGNASGANTAGTGASGGGLSAGDGAAGNNCSNVGGSGRVRITWED